MGEEVLVHNEQFPQDTRDDVWLGDVGQRGWVVLTKDKHIRYRAIEVHALLPANVRAFVLAARADLSGAEIGQIFVKALLAMKKLCATTAPAFIALVSRDSKVTLIKS